jgi:hypothetical protein
MRDLRPDEINHVYGGTRSGTGKRGHTDKKSDKRTDRRTDKRTDKKHRTA